MPEGTARRTPDEEWGCFLGVSEAFNQGGGKVRDTFGYRSLIPTTGIL